LWGLEHPRLDRGLGKEAFPKSFGLGGGNQEGGNAPS